MAEVAEVTLLPTRHAVSYGLRAALSDLKGSGG